MTRTAPPPCSAKPRSDSLRTITYDPEHRPEIASLLLSAALCTGRTPIDIVDELGDRGAAALKALVTEAVNEHLRPLRQRRRELAGDPTIVHRVLEEGNARANAIAERTLQTVRAVMNMSY